MSAGKPMQLVEKGEDRYVQIFEIDAEVLGVFAAIAVQGIQDGGIEFSLESPDLTAEDLVGAGEALLDELGRLVPFSRGAEDSS